MLRSFLKVLVLGATLAAPALVASSTAVQAEIIAVHDSRHGDARRDDHRHGWNRGEAYRRDWHRHDWRRDDWRRWQHRPAWHWCHDRWGRAFACR